MESRTRPREHPHPQPLEYIKIALVLVVITAVEVAVIYTPARNTPALIVPALIALSALKFSLVVLWYMHLRFDSRLFSYLFFGGLGLTGAVLFALMALFRIIVG